MEIKMLNRQEIKNKLYELLDEIGAIETDEEGNRTLLGSMDSIQFISLIVEIEECLTAADRLGFSGAVPTDEHCGQHHRAQCRIAPPHRADRTQPGHGIGAKGKICPAGDAQRSGQDNTAE